MVPQEERTMLSGGNSEQEKRKIMRKRLVDKEYALNPLHVTIVRSKQLLNMKLEIHNE